MSGDVCRMLEEICPVCHVRCVSYVRGDVCYVGEMCVICLEACRDCQMRCAPYVWRNIGTIK